jgi:hypothetical protein
MYRRSPKLDSAPARFGVLAMAHSQPTEDAPPHMTGSWAASPWADWFGCALLGPQRPAVFHVDSLRGAAARTTHYPLRTTHHTHRTSDRLLSHPLLPHLELLPLSLSRPPTSTRPPPARLPCCCSSLVFLSVVVLAFTCASSSSGVLPFWYVCAASFQFSSRLGACACIASHPPMTPIALWPQPAPLPARSHGMHGLDLFSSRDACMRHVWSLVLVLLLLLRLRGLPCALTSAARTPSLAAKRALHAQGWRCRREPRATPAHVIRLVRPRLLTARTDSPRPSICLPHGRSLFPHGPNLSVLSRRFCRSLSGLSPSCLRLAL